MRCTPEPWKVDKVNYPTDIYASPDEKHIGPTLIAQTKNVDYPYKMAEANAARIVGCVNGCAGLNPVAYQACVKALQAAEKWARLTQTDSPAWLDDAAAALAQTIEK